MIIKVGIVPFHHKHTSQSDHNYHSSILFTTQTIKELITNTVIQSNQWGICILIMILIILTFARHLMFHL